MGIWDFWGGKSRKNSNAKFIWLPVVIARNVFAILISKVWDWFFFFSWPKADGLRLSTGAFLQRIKLQHWSPIISQMVIPFTSHTISIGIKTFFRIFETFKPQFGCKIYFAHNFIPMNDFKFNLFLQSWGAESPC